MRGWVKALLCLLVAVLVLGLAGFGYGMVVVRRSWPDIDGTIQAEGLQDEVTIIRYQQYLDSTKNDREFQKKYMIGPIEIKDARGRKVLATVDGDEGVFPTTKEGLAGLMPVFAAGGTVTAGNSSQMTDGAAASVIMSAEKAAELGLKPLAKLKYYTTVGCKPDEMGLGPLYAIPKLMEKSGMKLADAALFEINEAFASQALYCIRQLGIDMEKVNVNGGAIALGHPLGCTGAKLCATLLANMRARGVKYGVESMCIGGGMGAAALFELCDY